MTGEKTGFTKHDPRLSGLGEKYFLTLVFFAGIVCLLANLLGKAGRVSTRGHRGFPHSRAERSFIPLYRTSRRGVQPLIGHRVNFFQSGIIDTYGESMNASVTLALFVARHVARHPLRIRSYRKFASNKKGLAAMREIARRCKVFRWRWPQKFHSRPNATWQ